MGGMTLPCALLMALLVRAVPGFQQKNAGDGRNLVSRKQDVIDYLVFKGGLFAVLPALLLSGQIDINNNRESAFCSESSMALANHGKSIKIGLCQGPTEQTRGSPLEIYLRSMLAHDRIRSMVKSPDPTAEDIKVIADSIRDPAPYNCEMVSAEFKRLHTAVEHRYLDSRLVADRLRTVFFKVAPFPPPSYEDSACTVEIDLHLDCQSSLDLDVFLADYFEWLGSGWGFHLPVQADYRGLVAEAVRRVFEESVQRRFLQCRRRYGHYRTTPTRVCIPLFKLMSRLNGKISGEVVVGGERFVEAAEYVRGSFLKLKTSLAGRLSFYTPAAVGVCPTKEAAFAEYVGLVSALPSAAAYLRSISSTNILADLVEYSVSIAPRFEQVWQQERLQSAVVTVTEPVESVVCFLNGQLHEGAKRALSDRLDSFFAGGSDCFAVLGDEVEFTYLSRSDDVSSFVDFLVDEIGPAARRPVIDELARRLLDRGSYERYSLWLNRLPPLLAAPASQAGEAEAARDAARDERESAAACEEHGSAETPPMAVRSFCGWPALFF